MDNMIIANDNECADRRRSLIKAGIIKENVSGNSTRKYSTKLRKDLKRKGLISDKYIEIKTSKVRGNDEGFYKVRSISDDNDYQNRRNNYFRILQENPCVSSHS